MASQTGAAAPAFGGRNDENEDRMESLRDGLGTAAPGRGVLAAGGLLAMAAVAMAGALAIPVIAKIVPD